MKHVGTHIKAVFFDHDDTLVATIQAKWAAHKHVAKKYYDKDLSEDEIREHWGKPLGTLLQLLYGGDAELAMKNYESEHEQFPKKMLNDTLEVLKELKKSGKKLGVITATNRWSLNYDHNLLKFPEGIFDYKQGAEDSTYHKPDPRVFEPAKKWLEANNIRPEEVIYVGDGLHDMKAAHGAGFEFVGVGTGLVTVDEFKQNGGRAVERLKDLISL